MDFSKVDLKTASEAGSWVQLELDGVPLFDDSESDSPEKPCRLHIKGIASSGVMDAVKAVVRIETLQADRLSRASDKDAEAVLKGFEIKGEEAGAGMIAVAVDSWENISWGGEPLEFNRENLLKICGPRTMFFSQVHSAILEKKRLFSTAAPNS